MEDTQDSADFKETSRIAKVLEGIRIVELSNQKAPLCGRLLADLGADVVRVEPPGGGRDRQKPPFADGAAAPESSLSFAWFNANKRSAIVDFDTEASRTELMSIIGTADVFLHDLGPSQLEKYDFDPATLQERFPALVQCSVTGFGLSGPYAEWLDPDLVVLAMSGLMSISGEPDKPPLMWPYEQGDQMAAVTAAFGVVGALRSRIATGRGQLVEVAELEVLAGIQHVVANYSANNEILGRTGTRSPVGGLAAPQGAYRCLDGYVYLSIIWTPHWRNLVEWMGNPEAISDQIFDNRQARCDAREFIDTFVEEFLATKTKHELFTEGQKRRTFIAPINTPEEFIRNEQIEARGFFTQLDHPVLGTLSMPGMPYRLQGVSPAYERPAPTLGQHTEEIRAETDNRPQTADTPVAATTRATASAPFAGVRVIDFTHAIAGPTLTRVLAEYGAEVIKVESARHPQRGRVRPDDRRNYRQQAATFTDLNRHKLSLSLDMSLEEGRDVARLLIAQSDVVINNFSPRVMRRWGLGYKDLRALRTDIIGVDMPGYGLDGPHQEFIAGAVIVQGLSGAFTMWDYDDGGPPAAPPSWYADYGAGVLTGVAIAGALYHREITGLGQHIEQSQLEATSTFLAPAYLDLSVNGRNEGPFGTHGRTDAPYGPFPCRGEDEWCVVAVDSDEAWAAMADVMGNPSWAITPIFRTTAGRLASLAELNARVAEWTETQTPKQVMRRLQERGVAAAAIQNAEHVYHDIHLRERGYFQPVAHIGIGPLEYPGLCLRMSESNGEVGRPAEFGEHTEYLLSEVAGLNHDEIRLLKQNGILD